MFSKFIFTHFGAMLSFIQKLVICVVEQEVRNRELIFQLDWTNFLLSGVFKRCLYGQRKCVMQKVFLFTPWKTPENSNIFVLFQEVQEFFIRKKQFKQNLLTLYLAIQHCNASWIVAFVTYFIIFLSRTNPSGHCKPVKNLHFCEAWDEETNRIMSVNIIKREKFFFFKNHIEKKTRKLTHELFSFFKKALYE